MVLVVSTDWSKGRLMPEDEAAHAMSKFLGGNGAFIVITAGGGMLIKSASTAGRVLNGVNTGLNVLNIGGGTANAFEAISDFREGDNLGGSANAVSAGLNFGLILIGMRGKKAAGQVVRCGLGEGPSGK